MISLNNRYDLRLGNNVDILKQFDNECIELTVTSPPYDGLRTYNGYSFDFESLAKELYRVTKPGGVIVWVVADETKDFGESLSSFKQAIYFTECGFKLFDTMIYHKNGGAPLDHGRYRSRFEYMFVFSKGKPKTFNPIKDSKNKVFGNIQHPKVREKDGSITDRKPYIAQEYSIRSNVWTYNIGSNVAEEEYVFEHPAIFPELLAKDHIISWSNEGDTVLDPFLGSGTTGKMAIACKRKFIGTEISQEYLNIATKRIEEIANKPSLDNFFDDIKDVKIDTWF